MSPALKSTALSQGRGKQKVCLRQEVKWTKSPDWLDRPGQVGQRIDLRRFFLCSLDYGALFSPLVINLISPAPKLHFMPTDFIWTSQDS